MRCPFCKFDDTSVIDSRDAKEGLEVRRRRKCIECNKRFTTYERTDSVFPWVIKKNGTRQEFSTDKISGGVMRALEKRPVSIHDAEDLVQKVIEAITNEGEKEISSGQRF